APASLKEQQSRQRQPPQSPLESISRAFLPYFRNSLQKYNPQKKKAAIAQAAPEKLQTYFDLPARLPASRSPPPSHTNGRSLSRFSSGRGSPHTSSQSAGCSPRPTQSCPAGSTHGSRARQRHP